MDRRRAIASGPAMWEAEPEEGRVMMRASLKHKAPLGKNEHAGQQNKKTIGRRFADSTCARPPSRYNPERLEGSYPPAERMAGLRSTTRSSAWTMFGKS